MSGKKNASGKRRILYDGWPLAVEPSGPAALHILELIDTLPDRFEALLALPLQVDLPAQLHAQPLVVPISTPSTARIGWEQRALPAAARHAGASLIHTTGPNLPLFSSVPCLVSPVEFSPHTGLPESGLLERLRDAMGKGGLASAGAVLWPNDLPDPQTPYPAPLWRLPPTVHRAFYQPQEGRLELPASYVLVPGLLDHQQLDYLAAAWSWTAAGLDESWSLVISDLSPAGLQHLRRRCQESFGFAQVETIEMRTPEQRAEVFQRAAAVLHVDAMRPWGDPLLQSVAAARPLVAPLTAWSDSRVGPAGYLVAPDDTRALGAAVLTLLVEESLAEDLRCQARARAAAWQAEELENLIAEIYDRAARPVRSGG